MEKVEVLLIWQEIPERTKIYLLTLSPATMGLLAQCHNKYIGLDNFTGDLVSWLVKFMEDMPKREHEVIYDSQKEDENKPIELFTDSPDHCINVIVTGQIL